MNIQIRKGTVTALIGLNGAGKSTFFGYLSKQLISSYGSIFIDGRDISTYTYKEYARTVSLVPQLSMIGLIDDTVRDYLVEARTPFLPLFAVPSLNDYELAQSIAKYVGVDDLLDSNFSKLSGGQQQLVSLTRAFVQDTPIILLDEPMSALDLRNQALLLKLIMKLSNKGKTIMFSTHNPNHALLLGCNTILLQNGTIICQGAANDCLTKVNLNKVYGEDVELLSNGSKRLCSISI